ncbi:MAG: 30S ribosomal protein S24e [Thermoproteota archaeon]|nr:30S ribosomal protein S24e [Candidatus Brockarchaeota archaeon]MBO3767846.1 30S ribosomal protein S24e [Candidatus Brockarchaeota archaeon]
MELKILENVERKLIGRNEVTFEVIHDGAPTPSIWEVKKTLAALGGFPIEGIFIIKLKSKFGANKGVGVAHVYKDEKAAQAFESKHTIIANLEPTQRKAKLEELKKARTEKKAAVKGGGKK